MHTIRFDCETLPPIHMTDEEVEAHIRTLTPGRNQKPESKEAWYVKAIADYRAGSDEHWRKLGTDPLQCRVLCIAWAVDDGPVESLYADYPCTDISPEDADIIEADLLKRWTARLFDVLGRCEFVAHNGGNFDFPVLRLRAMKYKQRTLLRSLPSERYGRGAGVDTMRLALGTRQGSTGFGLANVARYFGVGSKMEGMSGAAVYPAWLAGEHEKIEAYCRQDVEVLRAVHVRLGGE